MKTKHTPGPWAVIEGDFRGVKIEGEDQAEVARCPGDKQGRIDARLIAAAPELLEALQRIANGQEMEGEFTHVETVARYQEIARSAIAKSTGKDL